jgi:hypothetical protein
MSTISKVAVYDARLVQEEPSYAVTKGALSVSVAPFQAIAGNSSQMTFQVLVPSLNVFVDRKIQLSTGLQFNAQLYYSGARQVSTKQYSPATAAISARIQGTIMTCLVSTPPVGAIIYSRAVISGAAITVGSIPPGTTVVAVNALVCTLSNSCLYYTTSVPGAVVSEALIGWYLPKDFGVPDIAGSIQSDPSEDPGCFSNLPDSLRDSYTGYCTAVGPKDLSWCAFPVQSCLSNMTATMNDCTVTTNGDTLKEQLLLTSLRANNQQRTTPTKLDTYAWGRDDAQNASGNFSSYSTVQDGNGELPNGSYPTTWFADDQGKNALSQATTIVTTTTGAGQGGNAPFPFATPGIAYSFNMQASAANVNTANAPGGIGWYVAASSNTSVAEAVAQNVIVPFINNRPVWTCGFPGGDLLQDTATYADNTATASPDGFSITFAAGPPATCVLRLLQNVPPMCMVGARLYAANLNTSVPAGAVVPNSLGFVGALISGSLGQVGSTYTVVTAGVDITTTAGGLALSAGFQVTQTPMPVFGQINVVEPLVISPLIWADSAEFQTVGLYGMTNMQFVLNFATIGTTFAQRNTGVGITESDKRTLPYWSDNLSSTNTFLGNPLRSSGLRTTLSNLNFGSLVGLYGPWLTPKLYVNFLTPGPDVTLPLVSSIPYVEFPRYVTVAQAISVGYGQKQLDTNTISLTSIPDMVMIYAKPGFRGPSQLDQYIPIERISVAFDNFSNLCTSFQQFNLYESAVAAGLEMDWHQWRGYTQAAYPSLASVGAATAGVALKYRQTGVTQLSGGPIILRMGIDITLSPGLAPGCLGNYSFQATLFAGNPYGFYDYLSNATIYLIAINTGFFETVRGQSAIRKTILNSADVEAASPETGMTKTDLHRMVGRGGHAFVDGSTSMTRARRQAMQFNRQGAKSTLGGPGGMQQKRPRMDTGGGSGLL